MSEERDLQSKFVRMSADLIIHAYDNGYEFTFGDAYRDPRVPYGHPHSLHKLRLAIDFNVFKNGIYIRETEDCQELGEYWQSLGGAWGGDFGDGNHFSLRYKNMA